VEPIAIEEADSLKNVSYTIDGLKHIDVLIVAQGRVSGDVAAPIRGLNLERDLEGELQSAGAQGHGPNPRTLNLLCDPPEKGMLTDGAHTWDAAKSTTDVPGFFKYFAPLRDGFRSPAAPWMICCAEFRSEINHLGLSSAIGLFEYEIASDVLIVVEQALEVH